MKSETAVKDMALQPVDEIGTPALFERLVKDPAVDVEKIERLMALWERGEARKAAGAFHSAMSAAQQQMRPIAADATNPQTRSRYASYAQLDSALRPIYTEYGFALSFDTADCPREDWTRVVCDVSHAGGHSKPYHVDMPADGKGAKGGDVMTKTHAVGASLSYGMRYLLKMIFNVAVGDEDRDGNNPPTKPAPQEPLGFSEWLDDLESVAIEGTDQLKAAWQASKPQYRKHLTDTDPRKLDALKAKAARR